MAGGFAKDGAVQEQIDASLEDEVKRARSQLPQGESLLECEECGLQWMYEPRDIIGYLEGGLRWGENAQVSASFTNTQG